MNNNQKVIELASLIVVSNDNLSKEIKISKNTRYEDFKRKILNKFNLPDDFNIKLFYFEAYSHDLFFISKDEEYVTANRKSIEYFYLCSPNEDYSSNNEDIKYYNYLKYYSVIIFSPIKILNSENQNNQRKKMKLFINNNPNPNNNNKESDSSNTNNNSENEMENNFMANSMMLDNNIKISMIKNDVLMSNPMMYNNMKNTMICNNNMYNTMICNNMNNMMGNNNMMNNMNNNMMGNQMMNNMMNNMNNNMMYNNMMNRTMMFNNMNNNMMMNNMMGNNNMMMNNMNNNMMNMNNNMMMNNMNNNMMNMNNNMMNMNNNMIMNNMMGNNMMMNNMMMRNNMMNNNMMYNNMMNNMNNNLMFNNPIYNNAMGNNMMNQNMLFNQMNINMMNPTMVKNMINQMIEVYEKNPMMGLSMMRNLNPAILNQMNEIMEERDKEKESSNLNKEIEAELPEFETIDIESNPLNKYIENAINISYVMKLEIEKQKSAHPELFVNISEVLSSPGLLSNQEPSDADYKYLLCLIGKILENNQITVGIYKENNIKDRVELSAIQFIFSGLINKKKYKLKFCDEINENYFLCLRHDLSYRKTFIEERKKTISELLY